MFRTWSKWGLSEWLYDLEHRNTQEIQLGLDRILEVAEKLAAHQPGCQVITVAGTNGKGSTVSALETIYHTAGYKVGAYTSPHLIHFNERIRVNMMPISDADLCHAFGIIEEAREQVPLTYFEMTTLAALWHFKQLKLDVLILEVGLGGRLDATNIVDADLSIITTIDYDHQDFLGTTLDAIGYEKAGILRQGKPFIYADINPPQSIIDRAMELETDSYFYTRDFYYDEQEQFWQLQYRELCVERIPKPKIQLKSAAAALVACLLLDKELPLTLTSIRLAMAAIFIPGRLQLYESTVTILYDVSHNAQSARLLAQTIKQRPKHGRIHAVFSALKDKDLFGLIFPLKDCVDRWYPAQLDNKRASSADVLLALFSDAEICVETCYTSPHAAFEEALKQAEEGDLIVVYGSFFTVSQIMVNQNTIFDQEEIQ